MRWTLTAVLLTCLATPSRASDPLPFAPPAPHVLEAGYQQCPVGRVQCFSGWMRRCEVRGNSAMWITSAVRCR